MEHIYISGDNLSGYSKRITKKDDLITIYYGYYPSGNIRNISFLYPDLIKKGTWYSYNERGQINKLEEYDKPYNYTWEDVLVFMQEKEIKKEDIQHIYREVKKEKHNETPYWYIAKTIERDGHGSPTTAIQYTLDGNTGRVLKEEKLDVTRHLE